MTGGGREEGGRELEKEGRDGGEEEGVGGYERLECDGKIKRGRVKEGIIKKRRRKTEGGWMNSGTVGMDGTKGEKR